MPTSPIPVPPSAVPSPPPPPPPAPVRELPKGLRRWARITQAALVVWVIFAAVSIGVALVQRDVVSRWRDDPASVAFADLTGSDHQMALISAINLVLFLVSGVVWLVWWTKAYRAAEAGRGDLRYRPGWALGGWFCPIANCFIPKRVADDIWTAACEPWRPRDEGPRRSASVWLWWIAWLLSGGLSWASQRRTSTRTDVLLFNAIFVARCAVVVVAALLAWRLVTEITRGFLVPTPRNSDDGGHAEVGRARSIAVVAVTAVVVVGIAVGTAGVFGHAERRDVATSTRHGTARRYAPAGTRYSIEVPRRWVVVERESLPAGASFAAASVGDGSVVTIVERDPAGVTNLSASMREGINQEFTVVGGIDEDWVELPSGRALRFSFRAEVEDSVVAAARMYLIDSPRASYVVVVARPATGDDTEIDGIMRSLRIEGAHQAPRLRS